MDPRDIKQASKLINSQLQSRGLLNKPIPFHKPSEDDSTPARIINVVHELIARRDAEEKEREGLAESLRALRAAEARQAEVIEALKAKNEELARRNGLLESSARSFDQTLRTSEAQQRVLKEETTRIKTVLGQVRTQCANDIRKRDVQLTKLKERLSDTRPRGQRAQTASITINPSAPTPTPSASSEEESEDAKLAQETADFLTTLSQGLADENDNLIALVRTTLSTLKAIQGLPDDDHWGDEDEERPVVAQPADFERFTTELDQALFSLKEVINQPNYVPLEALTEKDAEIGRLKAKNEMLETEWKKAIELVDEWNRTLSRGFTQQNLAAEEREKRGKALADSEEILQSPLRRDSPRKGSPRRSVMEVFKERGMDEEEYEEEVEEEYEEEYEEGLNEGLRAVLSMVQEEDEEEEEVEGEQALEAVTEEAPEQARAAEETQAEETEKDMDNGADQEAEQQAAQEAEAVIEALEQQERLAPGDQDSQYDQSLEPAEAEPSQRTESRNTSVQSPAPTTKSTRSKRKSRSTRSTPTPTLSPEPQQPTPNRTRKSSSAKDTPFRQLFEDREIATKSPSMVPNARRRGSTLTALDEPEEIPGVSKAPRRSSRRVEVITPEEVQEEDDIPPVPPIPVTVVSKTPAKAKTPALSKAPVLKKTPAPSKTPSRKSPRKKATVDALDPSAQQLAQEELQATPARVLELKGAAAKTTRRTRSSLAAAVASPAKPATESKRRTRRTAAEEEEVGETTEIEALESIMDDTDSAPPKKLKLKPRSTRVKKGKEPEPEPEPEKEAEEDLDMLLARAVRDEPEAPQPQPELETAPRTLRGRRAAEVADTTADSTLDDTFAAVTTGRRRSTRLKEIEPTPQEEAAPRPKALALARSMFEPKPADKEGEGEEKMGRARRRSLRNREKHPRSTAAQEEQNPAEGRTGRKRKAAETEDVVQKRMSPRKRVSTARGGV